VGLLLRLVQPSSVTADAETVSQHLRDMTGCDVSLHPNDYLCYNCYKVHSSILTSLQSKQQEPDCTLQSLMEIWIAKGGDKDTDALTRAVLKAVLFVAAAPPAEDSPTSLGKPDFPSSISVALHW